MPFVHYFLVILLLITSVASLLAQVPASPKAALQAFVECDELAGAIAVVADKEKILSLKNGRFDICRQNTHACRSLFWIASQSKPITAAAVMMLVDERKIALDDPVEKYLPEFSGQMVVAEKDSDHVLPDASPPIRSPCAKRLPT